MDRYELRRQDFSLAEYQEEVRGSFAEFFAKECPTSIVRDHEPLGFAAGLWKQLVAMGAATMGLPAEFGGDDSSLVDLALIVEEAGRAMAPVPLVSHAVTTRTLARLRAPEAILVEAGQGNRIFTIALAETNEVDRQLVPEAAISRDVLALDNDALCLFTADRPSVHTPNQASLPIGWWKPARSVHRRVLATGEEARHAFRLAVDEWRILTATSLVGLTAASLKAAVEFAKTRETLGVPIGALQGVAFPLADVAIGVAGARNVAWKAAWMSEHEPGARPDLPLIAYSYAGQVATEGTVASAHTQGGLGVSCEADASMFLLRANGWASLGGDRLEMQAAIGREYAATVNETV